MKKMKNRFPTYNKKYKPLSDKEITELVKEMEKSFKKMILNPPKGKNNGQDNSTRNI